MGLLGADVVIGSSSDDQYKCGSSSVSFGGEERQLKACSLLHTHVRTNNLWSMVPDYQGERKPRKGQNQIKTGQKREACQSQEKFKAVAVDKGRKPKKTQKEWSKTHTR
nr:hypothetical protein [Tanacetum cinerariifolium]